MFTNFAWRNLRMIQLSKKQLLLSLILTTAFTCFIMNFGTQHGTFSFWADNVSNISSARLFKSVGMDIYKNPVTVLLKKSEKNSEVYPKDLNKDLYFQLPGENLPLFLVWPEVPRPYPLGAWVWYAPYSWLVFNAGWSIQQATLVSSFVFIFTAHISFFLFLNIFLSQGFASSLPVRALQHATLFFCYVSFIHWSGEGQYDLIAMIPTILMIRFYYKKQYPLALLSYGIALFFNFKPLFILGLPLLTLGKSARKIRGFKAKDWILILMSALLGFLAMLIFYWNLTYVTDSVLFGSNRYHFGKILNQSAFKIAAYLILNWGVVVYFGIKRKWEMFVTLLSINFVLLTTPLVQDWYVLFLFPIFLLLDPMRRDYKWNLLAAFMAFLGFTSTYLRESPFKFAFFKVLWRNLNQ